MADDQYTLNYTHDYDNDTKLEYKRAGNDALITLSFTSEDPDAGTEVMLYHGEAGESANELIHDCRAEISDYLDRMDSSSFFEQQGMKASDGIHSQDDYYSEYTRSALYAFEGALKQAEMETLLSWQPINSDKADWLYSSHSGNDIKRGCIGHLRGDFGRNGNEFWTSWFDHQANLKTGPFREELQNVMGTLVKAGGLLHNYAEMSKQCRQGTEVYDSYGFHAETKQYEYCLRCTPRMGDYHFYLYCYDKDAQRIQVKESIKAQLTEPTRKSTLPPANKKKEMEI